MAQSGEQSGSLSVEQKLLVLEQKLQALELRERSTVGSSVSTTATETSPFVPSSEEHPLTRLLKQSSAGAAWPWGGDSRGRSFPEPFVPGTASVVPSTTSAESDTTATAATTATSTTSANVTASVSAPTHTYVMPPTPTRDPPAFDGQTDVREWSLDFGLWLRTTGMAAAPSAVRRDWLQVACKGSVGQLVRHFPDDWDFDACVRRLAELYPVLKTDLYYRSLLDAVPALSTVPTQADVELLNQSLQESLSKMTAGTMSEQSQLLLLQSKVPAPLWKRLRESHHYRARTHCYDDLLAVLRTWSAERALDVHVSQFPASFTASPATVADPPSVLYGAAEGGGSRGGPHGGGRGRGRQSGVAGSATVVCHKCGNRGHSKW